jgi:DNA-directed RNA polymerase specialized sigma24 family protein
MSRGRKKARPLTPEQSARASQFFPLACQLFGEFMRARPWFDPDAAWDQSMLGLTSGAKGWRPDGGANEMTYIRESIVKRLYCGRPKVGDAFWTQRVSVGAKRDGEPAEEDLRVAKTPQPVDELIRAEAPAYLGRLLARAGLTEKQRTYLRLRFYEDLDDSEVAERHGTTRQAVSDAIVRALDKLAKVRRRDVAEGVA